MTVFKSSVMGHNGQLGLSKQLLTCFPRQKASESSNSPVVQNVQAEDMGVTTQLCWTNSGQQWGSLGINKDEQLPNGLLDWTEAEGKWEGK